MQSRVTLKEILKLSHQKIASIMVKQMSRNKVIDYCKYFLSAN